MSINCQKKSKKGWWCKYD